MKKCKCKKIKEKVGKIYQWNTLEACNMLEAELKKLKKSFNFSKISEFEDENYACCCPTCGEIICNLCV